MKFKDLYVDFIFLLILGRSTVFKDKFQLGILESNRNRIIINKFNHQTIQELVRFIYCEKVLDLNENASNLLRAADEVRHFCFIK